MASSTVKNALALAAALAIGLVAVAIQHQRHFDPHIVWDGFTLPGFDAHVYVAMAEEPRVFTVGPWGYRILLPAILGSTLPPRLIVPGFEWAARISLALAAPLLFLYLRVRGATVRAALLAAAAALATPSVSAVFDNPFLVEPVALCLLLVALIAIEGGAGPWPVSLALLLLALSKEVWVFLLPLVFLRKKAGARGNTGSALRETARRAAPALWMVILLRAMWSPQTALSIPSLAESATSFDFVGALGTTLLGLRAVAPQFLMGGLALVALASLRDEGARETLRQHSLPLLGFAALPLAAAMYTGDSASTSFFTDDVRRLLIYALPFITALAVHLDPAHGVPRTLPDSGRPGMRVTAGLTVLLALAPLGLDRYWRIDLGATRDGPYVLGFVRESLRTARRLDRGDAVTFDPAERRFAWGVSPASELGKLRFFLRRGFGDVAHYGIHDIRMRDHEAALVLPLLRPRSLKLTLTMDAREAAWMTVSVGGRKVGEALIGPQAVAATFLLDAASLFRGDNLVELSCDNGPAAMPRLLRIEIAPEAATP